jgi:hypothetical protein
MSLLDAAAVAILAVLVVLLVRAVYVLGRNPHQQIREHEKLSGPFPPDVPFAERLRRVSLHGVSPSNPGRIWLLLAVVGILLGLVLWLR